MAISPDERRFLKYWEEQRKEGRGSFVGVYTFGLFILFYMAFLAVGLFSGWPFLKVAVMLTMAAGAIVAAFVAATILWKVNQKKFTGIVLRELKEGEKNRENPA